MPDIGGEHYPVGVVALRFKNNGKALFVKWKAASNRVEWRGSR